MILFYGDQSKEKWEGDVEEVSDYNNFWLEYQFACFCMENTIKMSTHTFNSDHNKNSYIT